MRIDNDDNIVSRRELIVVDRSRDAILRMHLDFARLKVLKGLDTRDRAARLAQYVDRITSLGKSGESSLAAVMLMEKEYANEGTLIGDVARLCGAAVCRHNTLLFKLLADEADLNVAMVRGNYRNGENISGHAWNELQLEDGRRLLIDVTYRFAEPIEPQSNTRNHRYLTVRNEPWYEEAKHIVLAVIHNWRC
ncbi:MAG: EDR1-related protein [Candidatus Hydrogenedentota bacterium]